MSSFPDTPVTLLVKLAQRMTCHSDDLAWAHLFDLYAPAIRGFVRAQGSDEDADDVVQDIFLKLVGILRESRYRSDAGSFRSYLATMIRNELVSRWRKRQVRGGSFHVSFDDSDSEVEVVVPSEVEAQLDAKWRVARRQAAIEHVLTRTALSKLSKAVYREYVLEDRPIAEVMSKFGMSRNSVYQVKTRVEKMIDLIEAEYGD